MPDRWVNVAAWIHHVLAAFYFFYQLIVLLGIAGITLGISFRSQLDFGFCFVIPISLGLLIWGVVLGLRSSKLRLSSYNPGIKQEIVEDIYSLVGPNDYSHSRRVVARIVQHGVDNYKHKFHWTGEGGISYIEHPKQKVEIYQESYGHYYVCKVDFERAFGKNEKIDFTYDLKFNDRAGTTKPYFGYTSHYHTTRKLILRVRFLCDESIKSYWRKKFLSPYTDIPFWQEQVTLPSGSREASFEIVRPRIGFRYQITW